MYAACVRDYRKKEYYNSSFYNIGVGRFSIVGAMGPNLSLAVN